VAVRLELGKNAIDYLRLNLTQWGGMWKLISNRDLESGCVFAYFPKPISDLQSLNLKEGLFNREERMRNEGDYSFRDNVNSSVRDYLAGASGRLAILQRPSLRPGRNYSISRGEQIGFVLRSTSDRPEFPTEVYQYLKGGPNSIADVQYFITIGEFWSMTCALTSTDQQLTSGMEVGTKFVHDCASRTQHILMNACDGDITLMWSANRAGEQELERLTTETNLETDETDSIR
jgi:hypothetical protein